MVKSWHAESLAEYDLEEMVRLAWDTSPVLAVQMASRLRNQVINKEIQRQVQLTPDAVAHIPEAIDFFVTQDSITKEIPELSYWFVLSIFQFTTWLDK